MQLTTPPVDADLHTYGFPPGYFVLRSVANGRVLDVNSDMVEDGTEIILWPETETSLVESMRKPESNNQVFFIDTSGALCSRSSGHAIDVERMFSTASQKTRVAPVPKRILSSTPAILLPPRNERDYGDFCCGSFLSDCILRRHNSFRLLEREDLLSQRNSCAEASHDHRRRFRVDIFCSYCTTILPGSVIGSSPTIDQVYGEHIDLVRVVALTKEEAQAAGEKAKIRRQWNVVTLLNSKTRTGITIHGGLRYAPWESLIFMLYQMSRYLQLLFLVAATVLFQSPLARSHDHQIPLDLNIDGQQQSASTEGDSETWLKKYGKQIDQVFSGPLSFSHLPYFRCLEDVNAQFDIALLGMPFDTAVTYRPGARFGPYAIRSGSRRQRDVRGYTLAWRNNPYAQGSKIIDCGDVPVNPFDNALAVDQMEVAYSTLLARPVASKDLVRPSVVQKFAKDGKDHPRIISLGGDHTIVLPILRALHKVYGPISVIHFDAHLDTWPSYPGQTSEQSRVTHGTFFYLAQEEGLMSNTSIHAGIRCKLAGEDYSAHSRARVGDSPVYLSLDIDVIDPGLAPATGTPEAGGWTTREVKRIIRGLAGLNFVGADIVEVAPAYDNAEITGIAAADIVHDFLSMLLAEEPPKAKSTWVSAKDEL
ncbi:putative agmatinase 1 [Grifola frondosa]|uniref:Putative agmatinase 1 n=1 Tax=Grifola frondosa TaxID=5627 RepID=A0A1C7LUZ8_GRIFR|nr:putative agmatinase 1 [Grifola frondosa]